MSTERKLQLKAKAEGKCVRCKKRKIARDSENFCVQCRVEKREYDRQYKRDRFGYKPYKPGRVGRPIIAAEKNNRK
jgi:hypothetical protein